ncbi:uncharacterized protein K452DRAFT_359532 [Aplosporella prunicola CBS 121167]|uniref:Uncharacterized protein n=1 Tax=Aplosporella prunicola CBS 121167 TaxID=1176127 RepID=A0A6A6BB12_9PEZI|nr:uncharacterized protein K452DRAFT_359532 [Aplosporella prunicola CBS 121167]KAF2140454.1 hypothetical protein K452DRAFT_359532 [Aplosporella prunicola CBS 121167]
MPSDLESIVRDLSTAISGYDDPSSQEGRLKRQNILRLAKQIKDEVEEPRERAYEYIIQMGEIPVVRVFQEWKAFDIIPEEGSISYADLAAKLNAEEALIQRFGRLLVSTNVLKRAGKDQVAHTKFSKMFTSDNSQGAYFGVCYDCVGLPSAHWMKYFEKYGRIDPVEPTHNPHNLAWGHPEWNYWDVIDEKRQLEMNLSMQNSDQILPVRGMFPFKWIAENAHLVADDAPLVVDVGGGRGQALQRMMEECPAIPAERLVLQDTKMVIEDGNKQDEPGLRGVKREVIDYFKEQPSKGALIYYLRRVMHDWSDKYNVQILSHIRDAMTPESRILITDQVIPDPPAVIATSTDVLMMQIGARERTVDEWHNLAAKAELEVVKIWQHPSTTVGVIECKKRG